MRLILTMLLLQMMLPRVVQVQLQLALHCNVGHEINMGLMQVTSMDQQSSGIVNRVKGKGESHVQFHTLGECPLEGHLS